MNFDGNALDEDFGNCETCGAAMVPSKFDVRISCKFCERASDKIEVGKETIKKNISKSKKSAATNYVIGFGILAFLIFGAGWILGIFMSSEILQHNFWGWGILISIGIIVAAVAVSLIFDSRPAERAIVMSCEDDGKALKIVFETESGTILNAKFTGEERKDHLLVKLYDVGILDCIADNRTFISGSFKSEGTSSAVGKEGLSRCKNCGGAVEFKRFEVKTICEYCDSEQ